MNRAATDLLSRRLGFGCGRLNGGGERAVSHRLIHTALDHGIRYFDTAPPYGLGASEAVLGDALRGRAETVVVATKAGLPRPAAPGFKQKARAVVKPLASWIPGLRQAVLKGMALRAPVGQFEQGFIASSFEGSLQQLQRERVDFLLLHEAQAHHDLAPLVALLEGYVADGRLGAYGSSTGEAAGRLVRFGSVSQYRCPVPGDRGAAGVGAGDVLHGALRFIAPAIAAAVARDRALAAQLSALLPAGGDPAGATGALALAYALARFDGRLLISTNDPQRLVDTLVQARHITASAGWPAALLALHAALQREAAP